MPDETRRELKARAAPHLLHFEAVSALRSLVLRGAITSERGQDVLGRYDQLLITRGGSAPI